MGVYVIAEAGVNHNGDTSVALEMIKVAKDCGADAVKFQTFKASKLASENSSKADYQKELTGDKESQLDMLKKLELDINAHRELISYAKKIDIDFLSTPFDIDSINMLHSLGLKKFKIPSGEITNLPYLRELASLKAEYILSTGMCEMEEVRAALKIFDTSKLILLHANTQYPTPYEDVNLRAMVKMGEEFNVRYGYSDHTKGIEVPVAAVSMGAVVIEKHFTLDNTQEGPDHKASLEPTELKAMISSIRNIELAMGDGIKRPSKSEYSNIAVVRKSIVAKKDISIGEKFSEDNITCKRPGDGVSPMRWDEIINRQAVEEYKADDKISERELK